MSQATQERALFYDAKKVWDLLNIKPSDHELDDALSVWFPHPEPKFLTFFDPGWSIVKLRAVFDPGWRFWRRYSWTVRNNRVFYPGQTWYKRHSFAKVEDEPRYRQVRMNVRPDSGWRTFAEQSTLCSAFDTIPSARVVVMGLVIHFLATGYRLLPNRSVRCADQLASGIRVVVGDFCWRGLQIDRVSDERRFGYLGLACSRVT